MAERRIEWLKLSEVKRADTNPKEHDMGAIIASIKRRGFVELPALDERTGKLVAGHGRLEALLAMQREGYKLPEGMREEGGEWLMPVLRGWASKSDADAAAYLVASNRLVEVGGWNEDALNRLLVDLAKEAELDGTGYDGDDVDKILADLARDAKPEGEKKPAPPGAVFQVLVEVTGEGAQAALIERLERDGYKCRPLIF